MASVIRLLPPKKIERHVVPYNALLGNVMKKRLLQALKLNFYIIVILAIIAKVTVHNVSIVKIGQLVISNMLFMLLVKISFCAERPAYRSLACGIATKLRSGFTYVAAALLVASGYFYLKSFLAPNLEFYRIKHVELNELPEGIPVSLALHKTDTWYTLNEKHAYLYTFMTFLSVITAISYVIKDLGVLQLSSQINGSTFISKIQSRLQPHFKPVVFLWGAVSISYPAFYFLFVRRWVTQVGRVIMGGALPSTVVELSGFRLIYLLLPFYLLPLVILWLLSYEIGMAYLGLGPMSRGKPLSESVAADKNGTLVDGLARPPASLSSLTAWHELLVIAEHNASRRKSIYSDVDGERAIWEQISAHFIKLMNDQIKNLQLKPAAEQKPEPKASESQKIDKLATSTAYIQQAVRHNPAYSTLEKPSIRVRTPNSTDLYRPQSAFEKKMASISSSLQSKSHTRTEKARVYLLDLLKLTHARINAAEEIVLATRLGSAFRRSVARALAQKIRHPQTTAFAVRSVARMVTKSIDEDEIGYVQGTISSILDALNNTASLLEAAIENPPIDKTDVLVKRGVEKPDVSLAMSLLGQVNAGFAEIIEVFEPYLDNLQVTHAVQARAKKLDTANIIIAKTAWLN